MADSEGAAGWVDVADLRVRLGADPGLRARVVGVLLDHRPDLVRDAVDMLDEYRDRLL
jgi:radical SAM superfamily enzyme